MLTDMRMEMDRTGMEPKRQTTVREAVLQFLREVGSTTVFGNPGSTELPMFVGFPDDFTYVLGLQESAVVAMADGYALAARKAAIANLHSAAGVGHAMGSLFTACKNEAPVVVIAGQQARSIMPFHGFLHSERAAELPLPYVKWSCEPARAEDVPGAIARAYYVAMQEPRGPTLVSVPSDDWERRCEPIAARRLGGMAGADPALLADFAATLNGAASPVIVAGAGVATGAAWQETLVLAEALEAPVHQSAFSGRNCFPEDHRLFAGFLPSAREEVVAALHGHDVVLVIGAPAFLYHVEGRGPFVPEGATLLQIVDDPATASWSPVGSAAVGALGPSLQGLREKLTPHGRTLPAQRGPAPPVNPAVLDDALLMQRIEALRPRDSIVVCEAPSTLFPLRDHVPITQPDGYFAAASGGLGYGLPAAVGIALARPEKRVVAILGDGSAMYGIQGLWSAAQQGLPVTFVIVKNRRYAALINIAHRFGIQETIGTTIDGLDFVALAAGQGLDALRIDRADRLDEQLAQAFASDKPMLVEVVVD